MPTMTAAKFQQKHLLEKDVAKQIRDFLEVRHWRRVRNQSMVTMGAGGPMTIGEKGMADLLYIHYIDWIEYPGLAAMLWIETKRAKGGKRHEDQVKWHAKEQGRGAVTLFANDITDFEREYRRYFGWLHQPGQTPDQQPLQLQDDF